MHVQEALNGVSLGIPYWLTWVKTFCCGSAVFSSNTSVPYNSGDCHTKWIFLCIIFDNCLDIVHCKDVVSCLLPEFTFFPFFASMYVTWEKMDLGIGCIISIICTDNDYLYAYSK